MKEFLLEQWRRDYIRDELRHNGFTTDPSNIFDLVVEEVGYALLAPLHEGKRPTYGALVAESTGDWAYSLKEEYNGDSQICSIESRYCADGICGFFLRGKSDCKLLWCGKNIAFRDEAGLFLLRDQMLFAKQRRSPQSTPLPGEPDLVLVHRDEQGTVTVMHWNGVTQYSKGLWSFKDYQYNLSIEETITTRDLTFGLKHQQVLQKILSMCVNILSPSGCGTTIIMQMEKDKRLEEYLSRKNALQGLPQLSIHHLNYQYAIAHILKQCDGAAIISECGNLESAGIWLVPSDDLLRTVRSEGGSRQLTAEAISGQITSPIITVSSDGPVRAFHQGEMICNSTRAGASTS